MCKLSGKEPAQGDIMAHNYTVEYNYHASQSALIKGLGTFSESTNQLYNNGLEHDTAVLQTIEFIEQSSYMQKQLALFHNGYYDQYYDSF